MDLLRYVPKDTEVVLGVDLARLTAHPAFDTVYERLDTSKLDTATWTIHEFTGIDLLDDIQAFVVATELKDKGRATVFIKGRWDKDALVDLVALNPTYETRHTAGPDIYMWQDEGSGKKNHAAFLRDDVLVMGDLLENIERVVKTAAGASLSLQGTKVPALPDGSPPYLFALAFRPDDPQRDIVHNVVLGRVQSVALAAAPGASEITVAAKGAARDEYSARRLADALRGLIAVGELHDTKAVESPWTFTTASEGTAVEATVRVPLANAIEAAGTLQRMAASK